MSENFDGFNLTQICGIEDFDFSKNTTYGLGGKAKKAFFPKTEEEAINVFKALSLSGEKFCVLGNGSDVLAADGYYNGYVICTSKLKGITRVSSTELRCLSGTTVSQLLNYCSQEGLSGLEFLAGIPASVGGLTYMNGGVGGKYVSDVLISATVFDGKLLDLSNKLCDFSYKHSTMRDINCIITSVLLRVEPKNRFEVTTQITKYLAARNGQPKGKSCGCVFKNPKGMSAGKLIDRCGLKGLRIGGATVSCKHANFIINDGGTAADVFRLIQIVKDKVLAQTGIALEEEVVYIGDF